jgi:hypothetical protein
MQSSHKPWKLKRHAFVRISEVKEAGRLKEKWFWNNGGGGAGMPEVAQEEAGMPTAALDELEHRQPRVGCSRALTEHGHRCYRHNSGGSKRWAERQDELR